MILNKFLIFSVLLLNYECNCSIFGYSFGRCSQEVPIIKDFDISRVISNTIFIVIN
jgi:hypothetical protein